MTQTQVSIPTLVTPPTVEPVSVTEAKKQCELSTSDTTHDDHLLMLISAAREQWESDTDSACLTQTWRVNCESFRSDEICLPKRPIQSITSVTYYDSANELQTLATSYYSLDAASRTARLKYQQDWPYTVDRWDAIAITYVAGYTTAALVPAIHRQAIRLLVGHYFENRDMLMSDAITSVRAYEALVARFMRSSYP